MPKLDLSDFGLEAPKPALKRPKKPSAQPATIPTDYVPSHPVQNKFPLIRSMPYRIAIIGDSPTRDDVSLNQPFSGMTGRLLTQLMSKAGIVRDACFVGNLCQINPPKNDIGYFSLAGTELQSGLAQLTEDLKSFNPNIILLLGRLPLRIAKGTENLDSWRGSLFISNEPGPFYGRKCLASYHPYACFRQYDWTALLMLDLKKTINNALSPELSLPLRNLTTNPSFHELLDRLNSIQTTRPLISIDIEGWWINSYCLSIATSKSDSFIIPFVGGSGSLWTEDEEVVIWKALAGILADVHIPKVWQNGLYDRFCFQYGYQTIVLGNQHDTMLKFWEKYCELEKSLGFQCSILTNEPYYKSDRKADDWETFYRYCCKDSAVTYEINDVLEKILEQSQKAHYTTNHLLLNPLLYMECRGMRYNKDLAATRRREVEQQCYELQADLDALVGLGINPTMDRSMLIMQARSIMGWKKDPSKPKKDFEDDYDRVIRILLGPTKLSKAEIGYINTATKQHLNVDSPNQVRDLLYDRLKLPVQLQDRKRGQEEDKIASDFGALLKLKRAVEKNSMEDKVLTLLIDLGQLLTRKGLLSIKADPDGRVRAGYNLVGTETGRITCYTSPTGSGYNLQTVTSGNVMKPEGHPLKLGMRDLFTADPDHYFFQCDLSGADGWTVGSYLAMLGDSTMLLDLKAKLKPASIICYMLRHGNQSLNGKSRDEIKELLREVKKEDWDYFACKQGIWGTCYTMGPDKLAITIAKKSQGSVWLSRSEVKDFQNAVHTRYRIRLWHDWLGRELMKKPELVAPNGFRRRFFGRPSDFLGQALAHMPQVITTWCTNTAMKRLWTDPENRVNGQLKVEPLHQVHDALNGQFRIADAPWACQKIREWFNNPVTIAGITLTIPFEGTFGTNWAFDKASKKGDI